MFSWLRAFTESPKNDPQLVIAPKWMYPIGCLIYHGGQKGGSLLAGIYRITRHREHAQLGDSVICCGKLEMALRLPKCAAVKLEGLLNQTECRCETASDHLKAFHNEVEY